MNKKRVLILVGLAAIVCFLFCGKKPGTVAIKDLQIPASTNDCQIVKHKYYTLCYDEPFEQAKWVAYRLDSSEASGGLPRKDDFRPDSLVPTGSAQLDDYKNTGYDRGHLCPNADMAFDSLAQSETFYLSNMSPQKHAFNGGIWENLEKQERKWAKAKKAIYLVVGGILHPGLKAIKAGSHVAVPDSFYKAIVVYTDKEKAGIGFIIPATADSKDSLKKYAVPIDSVEKHTGLDLFPGLPDNDEKVMESKVNFATWGL